MEYVPHVGMHNTASLYTESNKYAIHMPYSQMSLWRNRLARSAVNRKVGGSSPPRDEEVLIGTLVSHQLALQRMLGRPLGRPESQDMMYDRGACIALVE